MPAANAVTATMQILAASTRIANEIGAVTVRGGELKRTDVAAMPTRVIVVADAGAPPEPNDYLPVSVKRVDVRCYGRTAMEASVLSTVVNLELKAWKRSLQGEHLVYSFNRSSGPIATRDPDGDWPVSIVSFEVRLADERVTA